MRVILYDEDSTLIIWLWARRKSDRLKDMWKFQPFIRKHDKEQTWKRDITFFFVNEKRYHLVSALDKIYYDSSQKRKMYILSIYLRIIYSTWDSRSLKWTLSETKPRGLGNLLDLIYLEVRMFVIPQNPKYLL